MAALFLLDTTTISDILVENDASVRHLLAAPIDGVAVSTISEAELLFGAVKRNRSKRLLQAIGAFLDRIAVVAWDSRAAACYAELRADLERAGRPLGALDTLIAAQAIALDATLVTSDRAFRQVRGLKLADWRKG